MENKKLESPAIVKGWRAKCPSCSAQGRIIHKQRNRKHMSGSDSATGWKPSCWQNSWPPSPSAHLLSSDGSEARSQSCPGQSHVTRACPIALVLLVTIGGVMLSPAQYQVSRRRSYVYVSKERKKERKWHKCNPHCLLLESN